MPLPIANDLRPKPTILAILDGWGVAPDSLANAITQAHKNNFDNFCQNYFCTTLQASGEAVGLPYGEMGNSEVGHLNIGAGKIIYQDLPLINKSILDKSFFNNPIFIKAMDQVKKNNGVLHLLGLISTGGVHSSLDHLYALIELAQEQQVNQIAIHAFLDGRDMPYNSGLELITNLEKKIADKENIKIATLSGRWWAMDRDNHWERVMAAYQAIVLGQSERCTDDAQKVIKESYDQKNYDEEFKPTVIVDKKNQPIATIKDNDAVIFFNFRADRARQLTRALVMENFDKFNRKVILKNLYFVTMTQYEKELPVEVAYPPELINNPLAKVVSDAGLKQLHIAETEKYAHVTYFINGGREEPFPGEDHVLIPSPSVDSYATTPEMSANAIKERVVKEILANNYDLIIINFANADMVAHTGDRAAAIKAIETVDKCIGEVVAAAIEVGGVVIVTADHGNAEKLVNLQSGEIDKEHSTAPVPILVVGKSYEVSDNQNLVDLNLLSPSGVLADVAPTVLKIMNLEKPIEMTGRSLV
ncbi:MAG TPA: 2,3-bisphosphoglycerate-independent phosphoglycerate mutase [bacterium]|nr:2,3-bisphosphoglycerate-independent phosphoglycerate mutase [bacterium]HPL95239.1 2,3-bisphosphoglycerate-independent phosphoglycerate mutase [bacterium]